MVDLLKDIYQRRELLAILVVRNLKIRYKNSVLGFFWSLLIPIFLILIYAVFARMLLAGGSWGKVRILSPLGVERMTEIFPKAGDLGRGLGWDLDSDYATVRGDLFGPESYGHSGYTGTSIWIDPETRTAVIFLTNRVHPDDKGEIISMRSKVANVVAASILTK